MPQLALLNLSVYDDQSKQIAHRVLPVVGLRPGYRYISLKNESNQSLNVNLLFVHIKLHDYVPEEFEGENQSTQI
jgi:phosphatidylinositol phospholipase C, beta